MNEISFQSKFLPGVIISVIWKEYSGYKKLKPLFKEYGFGFMVPKQNLVIIDGEQIPESQDDMPYIYFIEAHEIAHIILNHDGPRNEQDELDADYGAYILLNKHGMNKSVKLLLDTFNERHNKKFDINRVKELENYFE